MFINESLKWYSPKQIPAHAIPPSLREWLLYKGSMTRRLKRLCGQLTIELTSNEIARPHFSEAKILEMRMRSVALIREITMVADGEPWIWARTVMPLSSLRGKARRLRVLKQVPLGKILFKDKSITRSPFSLAKLDPKVFSAESQYPAFARRSFFYLSQKPILLTEIFLPDLLKRIL